MKLVYFLVFIIFSCDSRNSEYFPSNLGSKWIYSVKVKSSYTGKINEKRVMILNAEKKNRGKIIELSRLYSDGSYYTYEIDKKKKILTRSSVILTFNEGIIEPVKKTIYPDLSFKQKEWIVKEQLFLVKGFQPPLLNVKPRSQFDMSYKIIKNHNRFNLNGVIYKNCKEILGKGITNFIGDTRSGPIEVEILNTEFLCEGVGIVKQVRYENTNASAFGNMSLTKELISFK